MPKYKEKLDELKLQTRREQLKRIRERERVERERERLLVLEGKIELRPEHLQDPVLKLHYDIKQLDKQAKAHQARVLRRKKRKAKHKAIQMKWTSAKDKLKLKNFNFDNSGPDTVVANLVYDESSDQLSSELVSDSKDATKTTVHPNPVFQAFDGASDVDDLYRIAEIYVNPVTYYNFD